MTIETEQRNNRLVWETTIGIMNALFDGKWDGKMEDGKFQTIANPFYVLMDADQHVIKTFSGSTRSMQEYLAFLHSGSRPVQAPATAPAI